MRNPKFTEDEMLLLSDVYFKKWAKGDGATRREAQEFLSDLLNRYGRYKGIVVNTGNYRNTNGMYAQLKGFDNLVNDQKLFGRSTKLMAEILALYQNEPEKYRRMVSNLYRELGIEEP